MGSQNDPAYQEFVKFSKFFTMRLVQAVVQSRLGYKISLPCMVTADGGDWFSVRIEEFGEVTSEIRKATGGQYPPTVPSLCLDFLLRTADGEELPLESWCVSYDAMNKNGSIGVRSQLYHQLGTLLKSVIAASRVTPTYRYYARKQSAETFVILYQIYAGEPRLDLGEGRRETRIGCLPCPFGSLSVDLRYRTKMVISSLEKSSMSENRSPVAARERVQKQNAEQRSGEEDDELRKLPVFGTSPMGYGEALSPTSEVNSTFSTSPASADLPWFGAAASPRSSQTTFKLGRSVSSSDESASSRDVGKRNSTSGEPVFKMEMSGSSPKPSSSFPERTAVSKAPLRQRNNSFPFAALLTASTSAPNETAPIEHSLTASQRSTTVTSSIVRSSQPPSLKKLKEEKQKEKKGEEGKEGEEEDEMESSDDSFVKVPANIFASHEDLNGDLGEFVRQCKTAPPQLRSFELPVLTAEDAEGVEASSSIEDIPKQLAHFEADATRFDNFISGLRSELEEQSEDEES